MQSTSASDGAARDVDLPASGLGGGLFVGDDATAAKAEALTEAVRSLLYAGLAVQARALIDELAALIKASRGPRATVIRLRRSSD